MKKTAIIGLLIALAIHSCSPEHSKYIGNNPNLMTLSIDNVKKDKAVFLSAMFKSVKTIILEVTDESLIGDISKLQKYKEYILVLDKRFAKGVFLFSKDGSFIRRIGRIGQGNGEYISISDFTLDSETGHIFLMDNIRQQINCYDILSGKFIRSIQLATTKRSKKMSLHLQYIANKIYLDLYPLRDFFATEDSPLIQVLDLSTNKTDNQYLDADIYNNSWVHVLGESPFYKGIDSSYRFVSAFMDTIISIDNNGLMPFLVLNSNNLMKANDLKNIGLHKTGSIQDIYKIKKIFDIENYVETKKQILFYYSEGLDVHPVLYNRIKNKINIGNVLWDDIVFNKNKDKFLFPKFCYYDEYGAYSYVSSFNMPNLIQYAKDGILASGVEKIDEIKKLTEDSNPVVFYYEFK